MLRWRRRQFIGASMAAVPTLASGTVAAAQSASGEAAAFFDRLPDKYQDPKGPIEYYWKYMRKAFYRPEYGRASVERLWAKYAATGDPVPGEWAIQACYYWWRTNKAKADRIRVARIGGKMAAKYAGDFPDSPVGHTFRGLFLGAEGLSRGVLDSLQLVPEIDRRLKRGVEVDAEYMYGLAQMIQGKLLTKLPTFPMSIGDLDQALELLESVRPLAQGKFAPWYIFQAEAELLAFGQDRALQTLDRLRTEIKPYDVTTIYLYDSMLGDAQAFRQAIADGSYNKYTWDPVLAPARPVLTPPA